MKSKLNIFRLMGVISVLSMLLAACGGAAPPATQAPATQAPATQAPATQAATEAATQAATQPATEAPATQAAAGTNEGEVDIVDWPGYIERGANDPNYD